MSVNVATKDELITVAHSLAAYGLLHRGQAQDLMSGIAAAQVMAHTLTYGESWGSVELGNRETIVWAGDILEPNECLERVKLLHYNTISNGGTYCLPEPYVADLADLKNRLEKYARTEHAALEHILGNR